MYALLGNLLLRPLAREDTACLGGAFWRGFPLAAANRRMESGLCTLGARSEAAAEDEAAFVCERPATWAPAAAERARACCVERGYDAFYADVLDWDVGTARRVRGRGEGTVALQNRSSYACRLAERNAIVKERFRASDPAPFVFEA